MSYIYLVTNKLNGKQYVGQHKYDGVGIDPKYMGSGVALLNAYEKYGIENFSMELLEECPDEDLNPLEQLYIEHYNTFGNNGYNLTKGGGGQYGFKKSKELIERQSKKIAQYTLDGKFIQSFQSATEANRQLGINSRHISSCCHGRRKTIGGFIWRFYENDNDLTDLSQYQPKTRFNNELRSTPINQYDDSGCLVKTYPSIAEAARQLGSSAGCIANVLKGHYKKTNGFRFRYANECGDKIEPYIEEPNKCAIKVNQYTIDGKYIKTWDSMADIKKVTGFDKSAICCCCKGKLNSAYGFKWEYYETKKAA